MEEWLPERLGKGGMGNYYLMGTVSFLQEERVLWMDGSDGSTTM